MGEYVVEKRLEVAAPITFVFERLLDHEAMSDWPGVGRCTLIHEGTPRGGVGAIRELRALGVMPIQEEVTRHEPPRRYDYRIIRGLPGVEQEALVNLSEQGEGTAIHWVIRFRSRVPLLARAAGLALDVGLPRALAFFKADTERRFTARGSP